MQRAKAWRGYRADLSRPTDRWYWIEVGFGSGMIVVDPTIGAVIVDVEPFFAAWRMWLGRALTEIVGAHDATVTRMDPPLPKIGVDKVATLD